MDEKQLTIEEKIEKIEKSESLETLQAGCFPQSAFTSYYFVSYCHKDYKKVFIDILRIQKYDSEIAFWYDRELKVGHDWEKDAKMHINDFDCLGVIFYVSENSVESPAIFREMQMAIDAGKPFIPIVLPVETIRDNEGKYLCGAELLDKLSPRLSKDDEKYKLYHEMFDKTILYFKDTDSPQDKIERMKKSFTRQPLLELGIRKNLFTEKIYGTIIAINNINVVEVNESDYKFFDKNIHAIDIFRIGACAFSNCRQLVTITIPKSVTEIDKFAFYNCKKLKTLKLSKDSNLEYINGSAFMNCVNLVNITLPDGIKEIGECAFYECTSLTSITIPNSVTSIGKSAFYGCNSIMSITIPDSVTSIGKSAFYGCSSLMSLTIPNSVKSIGDFTFAGCGSITSITIPDSVTSIGKSAFHGCSKLKSITIPDSVTNIGANAFVNCSNLMSITIPNSVKSIAKRSFYECDSLTSITIPNSVTSIGDSAFDGCSSLTSIIFDGTIEKWKKIFKSGKITNLHIIKDVMEAFMVEYAIDIETEEVVTVSCTDGDTTIKNIIYKYII